MTLVGSQALVFGVFARVHSKSVGFDTPSRLSDWVEKDFSLERGLVTGALFFLAGFGVDLAIFVEWINRSLGELNAVRPALFAMTFMMLGMQLVFASFFLSVFRIKVHAVTTPMAAREDEVILLP
jgi:hypothetical protein